MIKPRDFHNVLDEEPDGLIICIRIHVGVVLSEEWRYQRTVHDLAGKLPVCHCPTGTPCHGWGDVWIANARRSELTYWIDLIRLSPYGPRASGFTIRANGWVVGLEGRSTLSLCSERALNLAPARSRAQT